MSVRDALASGESLFLAEVRRVGQLATSLVQGRYTFALVDEAFRGTNVADASDATHALVDALRQCATGLVVLTTHLTEVATTVQGAPGVALACFDAQQRGTEWRFSFQLREGISKQRLGMMLLAREGVTADFAEIIARAGSPLSVSGKQSP